MTYWIVPGILGTCSIQEMTPKGAIIIDVRDLIDGWNNSLVIRERVQVIFKALSTGFPVIIRCEGGISRSNALAITTLCFMNGKSWEENEDFVRKKVTRTQINLSLKEACKEALNKKGEKNE